jgi:histone H3/H4
MARKKKTKASRTSRKSRDMLVVTSKIKAYMHGKKMNTSADAIACLSDRVYAMLDCAVDRTKANGRKTVKPQDI